MSRTSNRRGVVLGFAFGAAFLAMSSVAFACTIYKGKTTVSDFVVDPATGADTSVSHGVSEDGNGDAHSYCTGPVPTRRPLDLSGPAFTVTVGTTTTCVGNTKLDADTPYDIRWFDVTDIELPAPICQAQAGAPIVGSFTTDGNGDGGEPNNATVPSFTGPRLIDICVVNHAKPVELPSGPTVWLEVI